MRVRVWGVVCLGAALLWVAPALKAGQFQKNCTWSAPGGTFAAWATTANWNCAPANGFGNPDFPSNFGFSGDFYNYTATIGSNGKVYLDASLTIGGFTANNALNLSAGAELNLGVAGSFGHTLTIASPNSGASTITNNGTIRLVHPDSKIVSVGDLVLAGNG